MPDDSIKKAIDEALRLLGDDTLKEADRGIQLAQADVSKHGRTGSHAHNTMVTTAAATAYRSGLEKMTTRIRDYAGNTASAYTTSLSVEADRVMNRLVEAQRSRWNAIAGARAVQPGKFESYVQSFEQALFAERESAVGLLRHKLLDPEDVVPWWKRSKTIDTAIGFALGMVTAVAGQYAIKLLGLN